MKENRSALFPITFFHTLLAAYGQPRWWSKKPYWVMFQAVLVQNTTWANVEKTCALLEEQIIPEKIAPSLRLPQGEGPHDTSPHRMVSKLRV